MLGFTHTSVFEFHVKNKLYYIVRYLPLHLRIAVVFHLESQLLDVLPNRLGMMEITPSVSRVDELLPYCWDEA